MSRCNEWRVWLYVARLDANDWCLARPSVRRATVLLCDLLFSVLLLLVAYAVSMGVGLVGTAVLTPHAEVNERTLWLMTPALGFFLLLLGWIATLLCSSVYHDYVAVAQVRHESSE